MALIRVKNAETGEVLDVGEEWANQEEAFEILEDQSTPLGISGDAAATKAAATTTTAPDADQPRRRSFE